MPGRFKVISPRRSQHVTSRCIPPSWGGGRALRGADPHWESTTPPSTAPPPTGKQAGAYGELGMEEKHEWVRRLWKPAGHRRGRYSSGPQDRPFRRRGVRFHAQGGLITFPRDRTHRFSLAIHSAVGNRTDRRQGERPHRDLRPRAASGDIVEIITEGATHGRAALDQDPRTGRPTTNQAVVQNGAPRSEHSSRAARISTAS